MKPLKKVKIKWSSNFAYAIGLLATDGNLSPDGRHIAFTSKDLELANNFQLALGLNQHIGRKSSGSCREKKYYVIQFSEKHFYDFLLTIGLMPKKTFILGEIKMPIKYFFDFLRGELDGDGSFYSYFDPRWESSYMFYFSLCCASIKHIHWLRKMVFKLLGVRGHVTKSVNDSTYQLKYAKGESLKLIEKMYYNVL
ncbi:MAG: LAGLIDADG family homing endonuclease [Patescibacteria group bacterium]